MFEFIKKNAQNLVPAGLIFLFAFFFRFIWLDAIPGATSSDTLNYILPAKSVALSGEDLSFKWNLLKSLFFYYPTEFPQAELPYFIVFPIVALLPMSLFTTTLPFVVISAATAVVLFLLVEKLLGRQAGIIAGVLCAINPWQVYLGRTAYDMVPAAFFFILAIYFLIREKGWRILISLPIFVLAFYSYIGTKTVLIPVVVAVSVFAYLQNKRKFGKQYLVLNIACLAFVLLFAASLFTKANRAGEIALPMDPAIAREVDSARKTSFAPEIVKNIFENKFTVYSKIMLAKTVGVFSPDYLFISGDNFTGLYGHGLIYFIDGLFLILGFAFMFAKKARIFFLVASLILISTIPQVLHTVKLEMFTPHLALFLPLLIIPIAFGISEVLSFKKVLGVLILIVYAISFSRFLYIYFFQFPLYGHFDFPARIVAKYATVAAQNGQKVDVYVSGAHDFYNKFLFYSGSFDRKNFEEIKTSTNSRKFTLGNISFFPCGDIFEKFDPNAVSIYHSVLCDKFESSTASAKVSRLDDGGEIYRIYNDTVCSKFTLKTYPSGFDLSDFSIEKIPVQKFCETFIVR